MLFFNGLQAGRHARFVTVGLQPQMKKYRCLWYKSTTNHNILYFVRVPGTSSPNAFVSLWKALRALPGAGFRVHFIFPSVRPVARGPIFLSLKPSLRPVREQGPETVQFGA